MIYDFFYGQSVYVGQQTAKEDQEAFRGYGFDGERTFFLTEFAHERLTKDYHGSRVWRTYESFSPVSASSIVSIIPLNLDEFRTYDLISAYIAGRANNPLVKTTAYSGHKAIINLSFGGSYETFRVIAKDLEATPNFAHDSARGNLSIAPGLIGVGGTSNSDANWSTGFRKEPGAILLVDFLTDTSLPRSLGRIIDDTNTSAGDSIEISTVLTDLITNASTSALAALANHSGNTTPANRISTAFPNATSAERNLLDLAAKVQIDYLEVNPISLLDHLARATVHSRDGHFYIATYLNSTGNALDFNSPCGSLKHGCFILPNYSERGASFAAPRLTAAIDTLWLIWPNLNKQQIHTLLSSCTKDLGATGVDPIYGQGLLDFECVVNPSGGVRIPGSQTQGVRGALYGASTASGGLTTYDAFDRNFEHTVLHRQLQAEPFDPFTNAFAYKASRFLELTAKPESTSAWLTMQAKGNLNFALGATYENNSLFGMTGSGHFVIYDGRSLGVRMAWHQPLHTFWSLHLNLAYYQGTASAAYPGAVSNLTLSQSNASLSLERRFAKHSSTHLRLACSSGNSGSFNSFGTRIELFGVENCYRTIGAEIRF